MYKHDVPIIVLCIYVSVSSYLIYYLYGQVLLYIILCYVCRTTFRPVDLGASDLRPRRRLRDEKTTRVSVYRLNGALNVFRAPCRNDLNLRIVYALTKQCRLP